MGPERYRVLAARGVPLASERHFTERTASVSEGAARLYKKRENQEYEQTKHCRQLLHRGAQQALQQRPKSVKKSKEIYLLISKQTH